LQAQVKICEVGPREGLQSVKATLSTDQKMEWISGIRAAGFMEIEVASFVSPRLLPQMADAAEVTKRLKAQARDLTVVALVPNCYGAEAALQSGADKITIPVSASEAHSLANVRKTTSEMLKEVLAIVAARDRIAPEVRVEVGISTAFGCSISGSVAEADVLRLAEALAKSGVDEIGLSDTTGMANPAQVRRLFQALMSNLGPKAGAAHFHNTRGLGLANCLAAYDVGVRTFDSSHAGLGGCPFAPGASGNVVSEDLVYMFESMGIPTGIDLQGLIALRSLLKKYLPTEELYGMTPNVCQAPNSVNA
jgi:hydroxymethylglutaryl-CoA lyase